MTNSTEDTDRALIRELVEALRPFAQHVGKSGELVTLIIGEDYWTGTLNTEHFYRASNLVRAFKAKAQQQ